MTTRTILAAAMAALMALAAPAASDQSEMVEVAMTVEFGGDSFSPVVLVKSGRTADIQFTYDPDGFGRPGEYGRVNDPAPYDEDIRKDHRLLLTVDSVEGGGYLARTEYMSRPDGKWTSQWLPTMALRPDSEASIELEAGDNLLSKVSLSVLPRPDLGSFDDARLSFFHSTGQNCHVEPAASADGTGSAQASAPSSSGGSHSASSWAKDSDCCYLYCGNVRLKCCNACCSDPINCPGMACCAGDYPRLGGSIGSP